ncbi:MAG TPA: efflux RND transporter periplasmic adaptor subunit [Candidatus Acidoferrales bacterium]|nr:efflux RND transporter periplasmic adaptor subunit [Candidatus Acidoferrales bacterium]
MKFAAALRGPSLLTLLPLCAALAALLAGCSREEKTVQAAPESVSGIELRTAALQTVADEVESPGTVVSARTAEVAARTMGTLEAVLVREGQAVKAGELLARLDDRELAAHSAAAKSAETGARAARGEAAQGFAAAKAQADVSEKTYERFVYLRDQKSVSPQEFDEVESRRRAAEAGLAAASERQKQAEAGVERAQAEARAAETASSYARIAAPFAGIVARRLADPGSMAAPGVPLFIIEDPSRYQLRVQLESQAAGVARVGTVARARLDALGGADLEGRIVEVEGGADPASHTIAVRVELPSSPAIRSGLFGRAWFRRGERRALFVPQAAVVRRGQISGVYALDSAGVLRWRVVTLGETSAAGDAVEILSGLGAGEKYAANPAGREMDGKRPGGAP